MTPSRMFADKSTIRGELLARRNALSPDHVTTLSQAIVENLKTFLRDRAYQTVLVYFPINNEVDTRLLFDFFWKQKKDLFLPVMKENRLYPAPFYPNQPLVEGPFHTKQPASSPEETRSIDLVLVPCVACDRQKYRLGYGKGFYDRTLQPNQFKIGLCYDFLLLDVLPTEPHDVGLDAVITDDSTLL